MKKDKILIIGACGQIGSELTIALREKFGKDQVIAGDRFDDMQGNHPYMKLDALDKGSVHQLVKNENITQIYLLAAMLSASGEKDIDKAWNLNIKSLLNVLEIAKEEKLDKIFWPSSIAIFGPGSPKYYTPQHTLTEPNTVYGMSKRAGEYWCLYYSDKFGVDVRSLRYPGLISSKTAPGGGTSDYAVAIYTEAVKHGKYTCYLQEDTCLPMMYMPDAIRATLELMDAPKGRIRIRTSYNISGMSFAPCDIAAAIKRHIPDFEIGYQPDFRQAIASGWPVSINDEEAKRDWGWEASFDLTRMTSNMLFNLYQKNTVAVSENLTHAMLSAYPDFPSDLNVHPTYC